MSSLLHAAGNTHVKVNSVRVAVIARAVQAATNPTEGQRMLQAGISGAILGGESREKTSTTSALMASCASNACRAFYHQRE